AWANWSTNAFAALFDPAGAADALSASLGSAAFAPTNQFVGTSDPRALTLANTANQFRGNHYGYYFETNADAGSGFKGLSIGKNTANSLVTSGSAGNENLTQRLPPNGFLVVADDNSVILSWQGKEHASANPDM